MHAAFFPDPKTLPRFLSHSLSPRGLGPSQTPEPVRLTTNGKEPCHHLLTTSTAAIAGSPLLLSFVSAAKIA